MSSPQQDERISMATGRELLDSILSNIAVLRKTTDQNLEKVKEELKFIDDEVDDVVEELGLNRAI